jgi:hypothetical protein
MLPEIFPRRGMNLSIADAGLADPIAARDLVTRWNGAQTILGVSVPKASA